MIIVPAAEKKWCDKISNKPTQAMTNGTLELWPLRYPLMIELYINRAVIARIATSKIGLAIQECDESMPVDSSKGIAAQCTAHPNDVIVPHISMFLIMLFTCSITA